MMHTTTIPVRPFHPQAANRVLPRAGAIALALSAFVGSSALAQTEIPAGINSPTFSLIDENGVNLTSNKPTAHIEDVSIGSKAAPLGHAIETDYGEGSLVQVHFVDSYAGRVESATYNPDAPPCAGTNHNLDVKLAGGADRMCGTLGGSYVPHRGTGSSMITNPDGSLTFSQKDGTKFQFGVGSPLTWLLARIIAPDGRITTLHYKTTTVNGPAYRVQSITRNDGLQLKYTYATNVAPTNVNELSVWKQVASVTALNNTVDYCDPLADSCTYTQAWPVSTQAWTTNGSLKYFTVTDSAGRSTRFTTGIPVLSGGVYGSSGPTQYFFHQLLAIRAPTSSSADTVSYTFCAVSGEAHCMHQGVKKVLFDGTEWNYTGTSGQGGVSVFIQLSATRGVGGGGHGTTQQVGNNAAGPLMTYGDGLRTFQFEGTVANRLAHVLYGDGNKVAFAYDGRGNITQETHTPTTGSALSPTVRTANFDAVCANTLTCNSPNWVRDARQNQTDYTYDPDHGGTLKVTMPAVPSPVDGTPVRPQVRYTYEPRFAWYKNASGTVVQAATPIWVRVAERFCRTTAALANGSGCTTASDEVTTTYDYGPATGANNLFPRGEAKTADGVTHRTCYGNDIYGNRISQTSSKAGLLSCP